jgi:hypothetical protein
MRSGVVDVDCTVLLEYLITRGNVVDALQEISKTYDEFL